MRWTRCLTAVLASAALALVAAGAVRAGGRSAPPSGKAGGHAENGSAPGCAPSRPEVEWGRVPAGAQVPVPPGGLRAEQLQPVRLRQLRPRRPSRRRSRDPLRRRPRHRGGLRLDARGVPGLARLRERALRDPVLRWARHADGAHQGRRLARRQLVREHALCWDRERGLRDGRRAVVHAEALSLARPADALPGAALRAPAQPRARHRPRPGARAVEPVPGRDALGSGAVLRLGSPDEAGRRSDQAAGRSGSRSDRHDRPGLADEQADGDGLR